MTQSEYLDRGLTRRNGGCNQQTRAIAIRVTFMLELT
jgi:hypothetical protein